MASKMCLGLILFFLLSLAAFPASSKTYHSNWHLYLSGKVLENGTQVHGGTSTNSFGVTTLFQVTGNSSNWELEPSFA
jgi:hypothetical protein